MTKALGYAVKLIIQDLGKGVPGALVVLCAGYASYGAEFISRVQESNLEGEAIWNRYKDECGEDIDKMFDSMKAVTA